MMLSLSENSCLLRFQNDLSLKKKVIEKGENFSNFFFRPISKRFCKFSLKLNMEKRMYYFFLALRIPETREETKLVKYNNRFEL